ncbi:MAG TPA: hypothetical protein VJP02_23825 [Candidatus Sulfotelmatobacter sp.]|nr:hypothetical protein [Candidatus Sulfotelmatobacter sp.]
MTRRDRAQLTWWPTSVLMPGTAVIGIHSAVRRVGKEFSIACHIKIAPSLAKG